tara:strand:- start:669 stop:1295 length:627 start_codon:yes stop_codon:yes gene_type:complete
MATIPLGQMFRTVAPVVDTINKGSAQANSLREAYTMQDIINTVPAPSGTITGSGAVGKVPEFNLTTTSIQNSVMGVSGTDMTLQKKFIRGTSFFGFTSSTNFQLESSSALNFQTSPEDTILYHGASPLERLRTHKGTPPGPNSIGVVVNGQADLAALNAPPSFGSAGTGVEGEIRYAQSGGASYIFLSPTTNTFPSGNWKRLLLETWV